METRRNTRANISVKVFLHIDQDSPQKFCLSKSCDFEVDIMDISIGGIGVFSKYFLPQGLHIEVEIEGKPFGLGEPMKIKGEVRHCTYVKAAKYRCGIMFTNITEKYQKCIADFIAVYERREAPRYKLSE